MKKKESMNGFWVKMTTTEGLGNLKGLITTYWWSLNLNAGLFHFRSPGFYIVFCDKYQDLFFENVFLIKLQNLSVQP